jgi:hypothetical protein
MYPNASVSGLFFAHPQSKYFAIGEISEKQVEDYARRRNVTPDENRKFLLANFGIVDRKVLYLCTHNSEITCEVSEATIIPV